MFDDVVRPRARRRSERLRVGVGDGPLLAAARRSAAPTSRSSRRTRCSARSRRAPNGCSSARSSPASRTAIPRCSPRWSRRSTSSRKGRAILGIGAAWYEPEHDGFGFDFPRAGERLDRLEEAVQICRALFRDEHPSFDGPLLLASPTRATCRGPIQPGGPPIMIGGSGEKRTLRLVAQYADMCNVTGGPATIAHKLDVLRGALHRRRPRPGRDHDDPARHARAHARSPTRPAHVRELPARDWPATSSTSSSSSARPTRSSPQVERARRRRRSTASSSTCRCRTPTPCARAGELLVAQLRVASAPCQLSPSGSATRPTPSSLIVNCDDLGSSRARRTSRSTRRCATASRRARR